MMDYYIDAGPKVSEFIESLLPSMVTQFKLARSKKLLFIKVDRELDHAGQTVPLAGVDTILVVLKPNRDKLALGITLAHEMTHVAQFAKGTLQPTARGLKWKGKLYSRKTKYLDRPWEVQAYAQQELVFRRAIEL
jgi:hypothetical protein